jgi:glycosyltransferase involved in cell wall biosynthesis
MDPRVSIVIPVHNGEQYLDETLMSVWSQTCTDFELIVVDDASDDGTSSILDGVKDGRIKKVRLEVKSGVTAALNVGLKMCKSPIVARLDADDLCGADRIDIQLEIMSNRPNLLVLGSNALLINSEGNHLGQTNVPTGSEAVLKQLRWHNPFVHSSVVFRREAALSVGGYGTLRAQDYHLFLRMASLGEVDNIAESLVSYRKHPQQQTAAKRKHVESESQIGIARDELARARSESILMSKFRQRVWLLAQRRGDVHRR